MIRLKNVSKYYYNKGVIATGFTRVNLELKMGEFVAIVGESGSGKSTLLNVISGLDSYEEGEMYINGEETSHYREVDFEEYRKKYVSNIFQNFNLVNSYTVYQNVELVLLLNGYKKKEVRDKILDILKKVRLTKYKNTKVSKLSGGQRQRVAIARALAKETPIIVCDEPTGNLDSKSAREVIKLLSEISKDKLVIVVTHNFYEIEEYATRIIRMHDGKVVSDKLVSETNSSSVDIHKNTKNIGLFNIIRLGIRNTFNIIPKFLLIFFVFLFITASLLSTVGSLRKSEYEASLEGYNYYFNDTRDTRIIIKKEDGSVITDSDIAEIKKLSNVKEVVKNDILLDSTAWFETNNDKYLHFYGSLMDIDSFSGELSLGRMPEGDNEVLILIDQDDYYFSDIVTLDEMLDEVYYYEGDSSDLSVKVVGIATVKNSRELMNVNSIIYAKSDLIDKFIRRINRYYSSGKILINNTNYELSSYQGDSFSIIPSSKVAEGQSIVSDGISYVCKDYECKNKDMSISINNLYYSTKLNLKISNVYNEKNAQSLLGITKDNYNYGGIFISEKDYNKLFKSDTYQSAVLSDDVKNIDSLDSELTKLGYKTLQIRKTLNNEGETLAKILKIIKLVVVVGLIITLFFISYFVIKLILKSRQVYFSTLRILGATAKQVKKIMDVELFTNATLSYIVYVLLILLVKYDVLTINYLKGIASYLSIGTYIVMYIILVLMSYLISSRFSSKVFKNSAMKTYREEV